jgi:cellulose synthase/poly-beta-1,6-N-acetylglucosamine synthase-like glycosyltransferase
MNSSLSVTIAIPTCYGGASLLSALKSVQTAAHKHAVTYMVVADTIPLEQHILDELLALGVVVTQNSTRSSQLSKLKQMIKVCTTDLFIFTHDDIVFDPHALSAILRTFETYPETTLACSRVLPAPATTWFEAILASGSAIAYRIGEQWNRGDNYLLANGRCIAFRTEALKKLSIPDTIVNGDGWFYIANKLSGGVFRFAGDAIVYTKSPQTLSEHMRQSSRFQYSYEELSGYFSAADISEEYNIPVVLMVRSFLQEFFVRPLLTACYMAVMLYSRMYKPPKDGYATTLWQVDASTK